MRKTTITLTLAAVALAASATPAIAIENVEQRGAPFIYANQQKTYVSEQTEEIRPDSFASFSSMRWLSSLYQNATGEFSWEVERWRPLVALYFPEDRVDWALRIIACESGGDPLAKNPHSSASGLFQHLARLWPERAAQAGFAGADVFDPVANIAVAAWLLDNGGTSHWVCKAPK